MSKTTFNPNPKITKTEYKPSVGFWPSKNGTGYTLSVNAGVLETLAKATEGCTLFLQEVPEDKRSEKTPHYRVTIFPPREKQAEEGI